ncbi:MAG: hypothetical protein C4291_14535 [Candidatus Dadabacteria bacterium]
MRKVMKVLPSLPPSAFRHERFTVKCVELKDPSEIDAEVLESYIRHMPTVEVLFRNVKAHVEVTGGEAKVEPNEKFLVVSLRQRAPVSGADVSVKEWNDLRVLMCMVG